MNQMLQKTCLFHDSKVTLQNFKDMFSENSALYLAISKHIYIHSHLGHLKLCIYILTKRCLKRKTLKKEKQLVFPLQIFCNYTKSY